jgi:hypothetical protein
MNNARGFYVRYIRRLANKHEREGRPALDILPGRNDDKCVERLASQKKVQRLPILSESGLQQRFFAVLGRPALAHLSAGCSWCGGAHRLAKSD